MQCWGLSDPGCVRTQNQDAYQMEKLDRSTLLCVVCDGMGGAKSGNIASSLAVDVFVQEVKRSWSHNADWDKTDMILRSAVKLANFTVYDQANQFEEFEGMGTTLVAALIRKNQASIVNVGDSRAYFLDETGMRQVTEDHSLVTELVKRGDLTPYQASRHPSRSVITRAMGAEATVCCDVFAEQGRPGQYLLLCSDGLIREVSDPEIYYEVFQAEHPETACQRLLDLAKSRGGRDNITVVLIAF